MSADCDDDAVRLRIGVDVDVMETRLDSVDSGDANALAVSAAVWGVVALGKGDSVSAVLTENETVATADAVILALKEFDALARDEADSVGDAGADREDNREFEDVTVTRVLNEALLPALALEHADVVEVADAGNVDVSEFTREREKSGVPEVEYVWPRLKDAGATVSDRFALACGVPLSCSESEEDTLAVILKEPPDEDDGGIDQEPVAVLLILERSDAVERTLAAGTAEDETFAFEGVMAAEVVTVELAARDEDPAALLDVWKEGVDKTEFEDETEALRETEVRGDADTERTALRLTDGVLETEDDADALRVALLLRLARALDDGERL